MVRSIPTASQTVHYVYDHDGHVIAEHDGTTGAMLREYVWLDDPGSGSGAGMPLALITGSAPAPQYGFIHTGQLDEPLMVTDMAQAKTWDVVNDPWGNALPLATPAIAQDLRLPGQYHHIESGLFHNWHRDYDPSLGRYIEADPIGLDGGSNAFAYAEGNPVNSIDPEGLKSAFYTVGDIIRWDATHRDPTDRNPYKWAAYGAFAMVGGAYDLYKLCADGDGGSGDDDYCYRRWDREYNSCDRWYHYGFRAVNACRDRANKRHILCTGNGGRPNPNEPPEWFPPRDWLKKDLK